MKFSRPAPLTKASHADHAAYYVKHALLLVHMDRNAKGPTYKGWPKKAIADEERALQHWRKHPDDNMGVVLGPSGLCSLDIDDMELAFKALAAVGVDLGIILGDPSIPRIEGDPKRARLVFAAPEEDVLAVSKLGWATGADGRQRTVFELRGGDGAQDVFPPSWHAKTGKPYRWIRAPWDVEEVPLLPDNLLQLVRNWSAMEPRMRAAIDPDYVPAQMAQAAQQHRRQRLDDGWDEVREQIRQRRALDEQLALMGHEPVLGNSYLCIFHDEHNPSFWVYGDNWICAHGDAPVGFISRKGYAVGDIVDLYQFYHDLPGPGKATVELAKELGITLPDASLLTDSLTTNPRSANSTNDVDEVSGLQSEFVVDGALNRGHHQQQTRYRLQTMTDLRAAYKPTKWLIEGVLPLPGTALMASGPGVGKGWLGLEAALAVSRGCCWLNRFKTIQGAVLLVMEEDDSDNIVERQSLLYAGLGLSSEQGDALPIHLLVQQGVQLLTKDDELNPEIVHCVGQTHPVLIVLDTLRRVHSLEENDSSRMALLLRRIRELQLSSSNPCSVLLMHHLRKRSFSDSGLDRIRGSSDITAAVDSVLEVSGKFETKLKIHHAKSKRGPSLGCFVVLTECNEQAVHLRYTEEAAEKIAKSEADEQAIRTALIDTLKGRKLNQSELREALQEKDIGRSLSDRARKQLVGEGVLVVEDGPRNSKVYSLADFVVDGGAGASTTKSKTDEAEFEHEADPGAVQQ